MATTGGPNIITDGLILALDAGNPKSYPGTGNTWSDRSGNGNNVTLYNSPTFENNSIILDGINDVLSLPLEIDTSSNFTIECVCSSTTMNNDGTNRQTIWSLSCCGTNGYQLLDLEVWGNSLRSFNGNGTIFNGSPLNIISSYDATQIHNYTLSCISGTFYWYLNGSFIRSSTPTYTGTSDFFKIGSRGIGTSGTGQQWNGKIYSVKVYNTGLSSSSIYQNYNSIKSTFIQV